MRARKIKVIGTWFHPPHIFDEIKDMKIAFERNDPDIDDIDARLLDYLSNKPRSTIVDISENVNISSITAKKRLRGLKDNGALVAFSNYINPWLIERDLISVSFQVKGYAHSDNLIRFLLSLPQTGNVWEFDHEWNVNAVFWVRDQSEINHILKSIHENCDGILDNEIMTLVGMVGK